MKRWKKPLALVLSILMIAAFMAGCKKDDAGSTPSGDVSTPPASDSGPSAMEQVLAKEDKLPLGGLQPNQLESRADIKKALPFEKKNDPIVIGWCSASQAMDFFVEMVGSAKELAESYGYTFLYQVANHDLNVQMTQIENYLTQNVDFMVINAVDIDATVSYYQQAVDKGIPVIVVGPTGGRPEYPIISAVVSAAFDSGYGVGLYTAEKLFDEYKDKPLGVAFLLSRAGDADSNSRSCGFVTGYLQKRAELLGNPYPSKWEAILEAYTFWVECRDKGSSSIDGVMNLLGYVSAGSTDTTALQNGAGDLLTTHNEKMNLLFSDTACRIVQEVEQHGRKAGEDLYICYGGNGEMFILEDIKSGYVLATATNSPYYTGAGVIELIHDIIDNGYDANNMPATLYTPSDCVNVDNIDDFYDASLPFAPAKDWNYQSIDEYNAANK